MARGVAHSPALGAPASAHLPAPAAAAAAREAEVEEIDFSTSSLEGDMSLVLELIGQRMKQTRALSRAQVDQYEQAAEAIIGKLASKGSEMFD